MKKYILAIIILPLLFACENYDGLIPSDYNTILTLKTHGEQSVLIYTVEESRDYSFTVMKTGNNPHKATNVNVTMLTDAELEAYSNSIGKNYKKIPESCYEIMTKSLEFSSDDLYQHGTVNLKTVEINKVLNSVDNYILPIKITSDQDSVNSVKSLILLTPEVVAPNVKFELASSILDISSDIGKYELRLMLSDNSLWDFTCDVEIDAEAISAEHDIVDVSSVKIADGGKVIFKKGNKLSEPLLIEVNNRDILGGNDYLPIKIKSTSMDNMEIDEAVFELYIRYNKILIGNDMLSTNAQEKNEGPISGLVDNDPSTYFHSSYSQGVADPHYFQIELKQGISKCQFYYQNRNNTNGKPTELKIEVSMDGSNWTLLSEVKDNLPTEPASEYTSAIFESSTPFKYFRFTVMRTKAAAAPTYFSLAEFVLLGR